MTEKPKSNLRGLGRGLGALIMNTEMQTTASPEVLAQADAGGLQMIAVDQISPNPHQPRTQFDEVALRDLAASISAHGIIQPLIVTVAEAAEGANQYWLVTGERRWRAAKLAGVSKTPAIVREASPQQLMEWALVENIQRADLNPLEEAAAYRSLMDEYGLTQADVADRVGKSRPAVANTVRLLQLPAVVQESVLSDTISAGHARALLPLSDQSSMVACLEQVLAKDLSVRQTENLVKQMLDAGEKKVDKRHDIVDDAIMLHYRDLEERFRASLGTRVSINRNEDGSGRITIHFYDDDDLQTLYKRVIMESDVMESGVMESGV
jgi:ParB family chromosome partitioning protein